MPPNHYAPEMYDSNPKMKNRGKVGTILWGYLLPDLPSMISGIFHSFRRVGVSIKLIFSASAREKRRENKVNYQNILALSPDQQYRDLLTRAGFNNDLSIEELEPHFQRVTKNAFRASILFSVITILSLFLFWNLSLSDSMFGIRAFLAIHVALCTTAIGLKTLQTYWHWSQFKNRRYIPFKVWLKGQA